MTDLERQPPPRSREARMKRSYKMAKLLGLRLSYRRGWLLGPERAFEDVEDDLFQGMEQRRGACPTGSRSTTPPGRPAAPRRLYR